MTPRVEPWLTKREVADHLRVSVRTVERLRLPFQRVGQQNRYRVSEIEASLAGESDRRDNVVAIRPWNGAA